MHNNININYCINSYTNIISNFTVNCSKSINKDFNKVDNFKKNNTYFNSYSIKDVSNKGENKFLSLEIFYKFILILKNFFMKIY